MRALSILLLFCGACLAEGDDLSTDEQAIIGGETTEGQLETVALMGEARTRASYSCSGTVIGPRLVLTAAHCFVKYREGAWQVIPPAYVLIGHDPEAEGARFVPVVDHAYVAKYTTYRWHGDDIGLLFLGEDVPEDVTPAVLDPSHPAAGELMRVSGFGLTGARDEANAFVRDDGIKRTVETPVVRVDREGNTGVSTIFLKSSVCYGDSGTGAMSEGRVRGVVTSMYGECQGHHGLVTSIDFYMTWIAEQAAARGVTVGPGQDKEDGGGGEGEQLAGCSVGGRQGSPAWLLLAVVLVLLRRRNN
jgi:MYXO-CTERM domain-containing protein